MMATPMDPYAGMDPKLRQAVMQADKSLAAGRPAQSAGTVTGPSLQGTGTPTTTHPATPTAAPNQPWWHSLADHIMSWFAPPAVTSVSKGAAYLADGGKARTAGVNKVIDEASK